MSSSPAAAVALSFGGREDEDNASLMSSEHENDGKDVSSSDMERDTTTGGSSAGKDEPSEQEKVELAKKETVAVFRLRLLVFAVLLLAAAAVSIIVYFITTNSETEEGNSQYEGASEKVIEAFHDIAQSKLAAISSLGVALIATGVDDRSKNWPYVYMSKFQQRASTARKQSKALAIQLNPLVTAEQRDAWELFVQSEESYYWIDEATEFQETVGLFDFNPGLYGSRLARDGAWPIWYHGEGQRQVTDNTRGPYMPTWQSHPLFNYGNDVNQNLYNPSEYGHKGLAHCMRNESVAIGEFMTSSPGDMFSWDLMTAKFALMLSTTEGKLTEYQGDPISQVYLPIFDSFEPDRKTVAVMVAWIHWKSFFSDILPKSMRGIFVVLSNSCSGDYTYEIVGKNVRPVGAGDLHDSIFDSKRVTASFVDSKNIADGTKDGLNIDNDYCTYSVAVYPSDDFLDIYRTNLPIIMTFAVAIVFVFTAFMFMFYDRLVERRQALVMAKAAQTTALVASLFPENVRDRLMEQAAKKAGAGNDKENFMSQNRRLKGYLNNGQDEKMDTPIADLFPHCTVMFCDIAGFTAWSSTREPAQVFVLLQTVYQAFDEIAKRRKVFKVETIGDSYVAVTGLPEPQPTHAVIMTRFAVEAKRKFNELTAQMESSLGPDTADLTMRFGLHSGPVTAGVLLGDRARFQLFGDTVNTAARMESTGVRNKIQCSKTTYEALCIAGKEDWTRRRQDAVQVKGKGTLTTWWLEPEHKNKSQSTSSSNRSGNETASTRSATKNVTISRKASMASTLKNEAEVRLKHNRLENWIVEMLHEHIRKLVAMRGKPTKETWNPSFNPKPGQIVLDEVAKVIYLPRFDAKAFKEAGDQSSVDVGKEVLEELHDLVAAIAARYHDNQFHNFEHACHVSMAVNKFLKRIVAPDIAFEMEQEGGMEAQLHNYTHGINSDPLTLLAIVFSALIHDVDHRGVSNPQLAIEEKELGDKYRNKSIAEQNSFDVAWALLMEDRFEGLRSTLFSTEEELKRFRQVIVNVVLATDIFDSELNGLRKDRWNKAFGDEGLSDQENNDLKATIVIEHIIQASDVSHTMQHWHIYCKWNKRLFKEMHAAFCAGRMAKNPAEFWYHGELGFFDNYVIPLAKKLKDCNVFGVSSDECLNYAIQNRDEWKEKGKEILAEVLKEVEDEEPKCGVRLASLDETQEANAAKETTESQECAPSPPTVASSNEAEA